MTNQIYASLIYLKGGESLKNNIVPTIKTK